MSGPIARRLGRHSAARPKVSRRLPGGTHEAWRGEGEQASDDQKGGQGFGHHEPSLSDEDGVAGHNGRRSQALDL